MTFLELQNQVLVWLDDVGATYFTRPIVKRWVNNAYYELQKKLLLAGEEYYAECVKTTLVTNQRDYVLPERFLRLHRLEVVIAGTDPNESVQRLDPIAPNQQDLIPYAVGTPQCYYFKKNRLVIRPAPDTPKVMRMTYSPVVLPMSNDNDIPDAPEHYLEYIAVLASLDGFIRDTRDMSQMLVKKEYYEALLVSDAKQRNIDQSRTILYTGQYDAGGFFF